MLSNDSTIVLHPAAEDVAQKQNLAPRLPDLQGLTVGLIDNHKRNADVFLSELGKVLQESYGVSKIVSYQKPSQSMPTPEPMMDQLVGECDAIVHAVAD